MAWNGDVMRRHVAVTPMEGGGSLIHFECGHTQPSRWPVIGIMRYRELPCDACSEPYRERIKKHQSSIPFDEVIRRLKSLNQDEEV